MLYYPVQIPYILNREFSQNIIYTEEIIKQVQGFVICFWEMQPRGAQKTSVENIIISDACIDLVASYDEKRIGFSGMSKTHFHFKLDLPARFMGARLKPGAFQQLTGLPASAVMDSFLPIQDVFNDFDSEMFFSLSFEQAKEYFKGYFSALTRNKTPERFVTLFDELSQSPPCTTTELYQKLHFSPKQCQRLFAKHYGLSPKMALSIIRFQKCLEILTSDEATPSDILNMAGYYDQSHFIKDFKKNIGVTPLELIHTYQK